MAACTAQSVYDYLRFGEAGYYVEFTCPGRKVVIERLSKGVNTMPTCRITGDGPARREWQPSVMEPLIDRLLAEFENT